MSKKPRSPEEESAIASAKEMRARDAALAMREYQLEQANVASRTEKLRAQRLAREREAAENPPPPVAPRKKAATKKLGNPLGKEA